MTSAVTDCEVAVRMLRSVRLRSLRLNEDVLQFSADTVDKLISAIIDLISDYKNLQAAHSMTDTEDDEALSDTFCPDEHI